MTLKSIYRITLIACAFALFACTPSAGSDGRPMTFFIDSKLVDCEGVVPQKCMLVRTDPSGDWEYFYDQIEGFVYEEGHSYEIKVNEFDVADPPADGSSLRYELVEIVSKTAVPSTTKGIISGRLFVPAESGAVELPADAQITISVLDVSLQDTAAIVINEITLNNVTQLPAEFKIHYDPSLINEGFTYTVSAGINDSAGNLLYWNDTHHGIITNGVFEAEVHMVEVN